MTIDRRALVAAGLLLPVAPALAAAPHRFTPEQFGARGDGKTNDSAAMAKLAAAVTAAGGGTIVFRRTTYIVGAQGPQQAGDYMYPPHDLLRFTGCTTALELRGNGARLQCEPGLRYGVFGSDGKRADHPVPYLGPGLATPYSAMVVVADCTGPVRIADLDLIGPGKDLIVGGNYGDTGWQIPGNGLILKNNRGAESVSRVRASHHPQDGIVVDGVDAATPGVARVLSDVATDGNGRQGCSLVGGRGYRFVRCSFTRTGRGAIYSKPGAGVDIEAEAAKRIRDIAFDACTFADNTGCGLVADTGDSAEVRFADCSFIGTTEWSAWPNKPFFRFERCSFVGALVRAYGDDDPARAAQFVQCRFDDDPAKSPTGVVYGGTNRQRPLADLSDAPNPLFERCTFSALHGGVLPWSIGAIYRDCTMVQGMTVEGYPRGRFEGANRIDGKVDLSGSAITGTLIVNGERQMPGQAVGQRDGSAALELGWTTVAGVGVGAAVGSTGIVATNAGGGVLGA